MTVDSLMKTFYMNHKIFQTSTGTVFIYNPSNVFTTKAINLVIDNSLSDVDFVQCTIVLRNVWNINSSQGQLIMKIEVNPQV